MELSSPAFKTAEKIPSRFTCEGEDISPELSWSGAPKATSAFVLILHDPDSFKEGGFTHWLLYNIPAQVSHLAENVPKQAEIRSVGLQGKNDAGNLGYMGPCPRQGTHRYFMRLYSLKQRLSLPPGATHAELLSAMEGKIIETAELMGVYKKQAGAAD